MRRLRTCAAAAALLSVMLSMSACAVIERATGLLHAVVPQSPAPAPPFPPAPPEAALPPPPHSLEPPSRNDVRTEMGQWLHAHGYKDFQIAALLAHARTESNYNPCIRGAGDLSYTFQWGGRRLAQLHRFAHTDGCPHIHAQLAFADWELRNEPKFGCFWRATTSDAAYAALRRGFGRGSC
jgi:tail lysozyme